MLSKEALKEYRELFLKEFNEELDDEATAEFALATLIFMETIYEPVMKSWMDDYRERKNSGNLK